MPALDRPRPRCPKCGSGRAKRLVYGLIDYERLLELGDQEPDFELGWLRTPRYEWHCADCRHEWGETG